MDNNLIYDNAYTMDIVHKGVGTLLAQLQHIIVIHRNWHS